MGFQILELYSGFQSPRSRILQSKFPPILESGFPYMGRTVPITRGRVGGGGAWKMVLQISNEGDDRLGAKIKTPQKSLGLPTKPKKIPGPNINPRKILCQISKAKFGCTVFGELRGHESSDCFEYPKKSLLKSIHPKKYSPNFPTQKNPGIKNFKPKNSRSFIIVSD